MSEPKAMEIAIKLIFEKSDIVILDVKFHCFKEEIVNYD